MNMRIHFLSQLLLHVLCVQLQLMLTTKPLVLVMIDVGKELINVVFFKLAPQTNRLDIISNRFLTNLLGSE